MKGNQKIGLAVLAAAAAYFLYNKSKAAPYVTKVNIVKDPANSSAKYATGNEVLTEGSPSHQSPFSL